MEGIALRPIDLFLQAGPVVKSVILLLILLSVWCWVIVAECWFALSRLGASLSEAEPGTATPTAAVLDAGRREAALGYPGEDRAERRQRVADAMRRSVQEIVEHAQGGLGNLAVISSVAPFIGLFGTVWGIMNSFVGIAAARDTSLAVVAPGIAEALAATAVGLAAAIPAAFAYNRFVAAFGRRGRALGRFAERSLAPILAEKAP